MRSKCYRPGRTVRLALLVGGLALGIVRDRCHGQLPLPGGQAPALAAATNASVAQPELAASLRALEVKLAEVRADLAAAANFDALNFSNRADGLSLQDLTLRRALLERLMRLYEQEISFTAELETEKNRRADRAREAQSWTGFAEPPPHSILLTDRLQEDMQLERLEVANGEAALKLLAELIEDQRTTLKQAEEKIRQFNEQLESGGATAATTPAWPREMERLRSQVAAVSVAVLDRERQIRQERLAGSRLRLGLLQHQHVIADAGMTFTQADLTTINARLDHEQRQLELELAGAETRRGGAAAAMEAAREKLRQFQGSPPGTLPAVVAAEEFELRRDELEAVDAAVNALRFMLQISSFERALWELRYASFHSRSGETLRQTRRRLEQFNRRVNLWSGYHRQQVEASAAQVARLETRAAELTAGSPLAELARARLAAARERDQLQLRVLRSVERGERLMQRLDAALQEAARNLPLWSRMANVFADSESLLARLWGLELFVAQDTITVDGQEITGKRSVTLGKVITAILILVVGYWLAGLLTHFLEPIFIKRFRIEANQANLIRRWLRVVLIFSLALFSLVSVKIPLTVFAFAGGALAIGLGFGLQTLLKNFVSGVIILFERPFRVGDVLNVAGQSGTVSSIGIRSSVLLLFDGTETLIPNSTLLENNLTNWTYSNRVVRFSVTVGVAYGTEVRRVVQLLEEIAERHGLVEKSPKPQVLFTNFGDSTLDFELRFWVDVVKANSAQVASDLRQMIAGTFAENKIVIAFPQRDLNLNATRPLQVQVLPLPEPAPATPVKAENNLPSASTPAPKIP